MKDRSRKQPTQRFGCKTSSRVRPLRRTACSLMNNVGQVSERARKFGFDLMTSKIRFNVI
jgi:hypothetical protein